MTRRLIRLAVVTTGTGGLVGLLQAVAEARITVNHSEPLR